MSKTETISLIQDVTDILKHMIVEVKENKIINTLESISVIFNTFADSLYLHNLIAGFLIVKFFI